MNRKTLIIILLCLIAVFALASCDSKVADDTPQKELPTGEKSLDDSAVLDTAKVYSFLPISSCKGKWGNSTYAVEAEITSPSGKTETTKNDYVLTEEGVYEVKLSANIGGETVTKTKNVTVGGYSAQALFSTSNASIVAENVSAAEKLRQGTKNSSGMQVRISQSSVVDYLPIVNLNEIDGNLIEFVPNYLAKSRDIKAVKLVLTDAYDSTNKLEVLFQMNTGVSSIPDSQLGQGHSPTFISITFSGVTTANSNLSGLYDVAVCFNQTYIPYFPFKEGFNAKNNDPVQVRFDNATNCFYTKTEKEDNYLVMNVSDPTDDYTDFKGFATGEVYLSFQGVTGSGDVILTKIGNTVLSNVEKNDYENANSGFLTNGYDIENMLTGFVGYPYYLPTEMNGVSTKLFFKGKDDSKFSDVSEKLTNGFVPDVAGEYYVRFRITNDYGFRKNTDSAHFMVYNSPKDADLEIKTKSEITLSAKLFDLFEIPKVEVTGGSGNVLLKYFISFDGNETEAEPCQKFELSQKGQSVSVKVVATDQMTYTETFTFPVSIDNNVTHYGLLDSFDEITVMYGDEIVIPDYIAIDYSKEDTSANNITLDILQGKSKKLNVGDKINIYGETTIVYSFENEQKLALNVHCVPETIDTVEGGNTIAKQFGNVDGLSSAVAYDEGTFFVFDGSNDNVTFTMPYALSSSGLKFSFGVFDGATIDGIAIKLADKRQGYEIDLKLTDLSAKPVLWLNGEKTTWQITTAKQIATSGKYAGKSYYLYSFIFDGGTSSVQNVYEMLLGNVASWSNGVAFDGFEKCGTKVTFSVSGASEGDAFLLNTVSNQTFTKAAFEFGDRVVPALAFEGSISSGIVEKGTSLFIPKAYVYDVLSYSSTVKMSVVTPDGMYIYQNVEPRECTIDFTEYGRYRVSYTIADNGGQGQSRTYTYIFNCLDKEPPTIVVEGQYQAEYKANKEITILSAETTDNYSETSLTVWIYNESTMVRTPVEIGEKLKLQAGKYTLVYYAIDEDGNFATQKYEFRVK